MTTVVALSSDLMDTSKIRAAIPGVRIVRPTDDLGRPEIVLVDLALAGGLDAAVATGARVIAYGSHVDDRALADAERVGADAMPRSRFFRRLADGTLLQPGTPPM